MPHSSRFSTATKFRSVHIFETNPQPMVGLDSLTLDVAVTPHSSMPTPMASNKTNSTPYNQPGNGLRLLFSVISTSCSWLFIRFSSFESNFHYLA